MCGGIRMKNWFYLQHFIDLVLSHMDSPNLWHFIQHLGTVLYRNHMVPDQGSAAHEIEKIIESPLV